MTWLPTVHAVGAPLAVAAAIGAIFIGTASVEAARSAPLPMGNATLRIEVTGVRNAQGTVHVDICRQAEFLRDCPVHGEARAVQGRTIVTILNLPAGSYAAQVFHDENSNGKVDRALFGVPKEGVGFSNDAPIRLGPPKWADAVFPLADDKSITLKLRYFLGGAGR